MQPGQRHRPPRIGVGAGGGDEERQHPVAGIVLQGAVEPILPQLAPRRLVEDRVQIRRGDRIRRTDARRVGFLPRILQIAHQPRQDVLQQRRLVVGVRQHAIDQVVVEGEAPGAQRGGHQLAGGVRLTVVEQGGQPERRTQPQERPGRLPAQAPDRVPAAQDDLEPRVRVHVLEQGAQHGRALRGVRRQKGLRRVQ